MSRSLKCPDTGKSVFFTPEAAEKAATYRAEKCGQRRQWTYKCPKCNTWHLTKSRQGKLSTAEMFAGIPRTGGTI